MARTVKIDIDRNVGEIANVACEWVMVNSPGTRSVSIAPDQVTVIE